MKRISETANLIIGGGWFVIAISLIPLFLFIRIFFSESDGAEQNMEAIKRAYETGQLLQGGVLLALGLITVGIGRILQVNECVRFLGLLIQSIVK